MVPGKTEDQKSCQGELGGQLEVICAIKIIESIIGSTSLVVNRCDNISAIRLSLMHPESVTLRWKQADLIFHLLDVYHSNEFGMLLVHIYENQ